MKFKKTISLLVVIIVVFSLFASFIGLFSNDGNGEYEIQSVRGEIIKIYGEGLYKNDSVSAVAQGKAQDVITIILGIPLLIIALYLYRKGSLKGKLLLTGTLGYFLYTYISYVFLWMYNEMFLVYVLLMSTSFFAFTLTITSIDIKNLGFYFNKKLPVKFLGGFQIFFGVLIGLMWIGRIVPSLMNDTIPIGLEHYSTLVIQGLDLGFIVPVSILSGILLLKRKPFGYLLSSVIIMKGITMGTAITAMIIGMIMAGVKVSLAEIIIFPFINVIIIYCLVLLLKNINDKSYRLENKMEKRNG